MTIEEIAEAIENVRPSIDAHKQSGTIFIWNKVAKIFEMFLEFVTDDDIVLKRASEIIHDHSHRLIVLEDQFTTADVGGLKGRLAKVWRELEGHIKRLAKIEAKSIDLAETTVKELTLIKVELHKIENRMRVAENKMLQGGL